MMATEADWNIDIGVCVRHVYAGQVVKVELELTSHSCALHHYLAGI